MDFSLASGPEGKPVQCHHIDRNPQFLAMPVRMANATERTRHQLPATGPLGQVIGIDIVVDASKGRRHDFRKLLVEYAGIVDRTRAVVFDQRPLTSEVKVELEAGIDLE